MYQIVYERRVQKDLDKIQDHDVERILEVIRELSLNPLLPGHKKLSGKPNLYRVKQGDYRVLYSFDAKIQELRIVLVSHRKESYRHL